MRHRKSGVKLNRTSSHRKAMFRNMVTSLFKHESIKTTDVKAKELRKWADSMITLAKRGDLHARRQALSIIREKAVVHKLFEEAPTRFGSVSGGYTRVTKLGFRAGDAAQMSLIELISAKDGAPKKIKETKKEEPVKADTSEEPKEETVEAAAVETKDIAETTEEVKEASEKKEE